LPIFADFGRFWAILGNFGRFCDKASGHPARSLTFVFTAMKIDPRKKMIVASAAGLPDFSWYNIPKNIPNDNKI
jgi:hypothetical protein